MVDEPNSSPPARVPFIIGTEPPGEEEPGGRRRAPQHITGRIVVKKKKINTIETRSTSHRYSICASCELKGIEWLIAWMSCEWNDGFFYEPVKAASRA